MRRFKPRQLLAAFTLGYSIVSCMNPAHDDAVAALGGEAPGVRRGPEHRPGQPCLTCHGGQGPGEPDFAFGGTVYQTRGGSVPLVAATITLTDASGAKYSAQSNNVGNFYINASEWSPKYPVFAELSSGSDIVPMKSRISGDGSCATCHRGEGDNGHMPAIYLRLP